MTRDTSVRAATPAFTASWTARVATSKIECSVTVGGCAPRARAGQGWLGMAEQPSGRGSDVTCDSCLQTEQESVQCLLRLCELGERNGSETRQIRFQLLEVTGNDSGLSFSYGHWTISQRWTLYRPIYSHNQMFFQHMQWDTTEVASQPYKFLVLDTIELDYRDTLQSQTQI